MRCLNCGGSLKKYAIECPFCGITVAKAQENRKTDLEVVNENNLRIDRLFRLDDSFYELELNQLKDYNNYLEKTFKELLSKQNATEETLDKLISNGKYSEESIMKVIKRLEDVSEELQTRNPIRTEIKEENLEGLTNGDFVKKLLNDYVPARVYTAASELRNGCERALRDVYEMEYIAPSRTSDKKGFVKSYREMFNIITDNNYKLVQKMLNDRVILNYFVHESKENDELIQEKYKTLNQQVRFLKNVYDIYKKNNLI